MSTQVNLTIDQGATFSVNVVALVNSTSVVPLDMQGFSVGYSQIRPSHTSDTVVSEFDIDPNVANSSGIVNLSMSHEDTANIAAGTYVYDVKIVGFLEGGIGPYGDANVVVNTAPGGVNTIYQAFNRVPAAISAFNFPNGAYTITTGAVANADSGHWGHPISDYRPNYISGANDVTLFIVNDFGVMPGTSTTTEYAVLHVGNKANTIGFREIIFANAEMYGAGSEHVGNSHLVVSGSQHPNAFFNNTYTIGHSANSHPLWDMHFDRWGIDIPKTRRWIYSMWIKTSHGGSGNGFPITLQAYTANSTHNPNTTSFFTVNGVSFDSGSTGPYQSPVLQPTSYVNPILPPSLDWARPWSRISNVIDLRTIASPNTHPDWNKDTLIGNTHVQNGLNVGFGLTGRLHFRDQVDQRVYGSNALAGGYPNYSIIHDSHSTDNEIQYWRVGDEIGIDYVGGFTNHIEGGRTDFWGNPWSRQLRTITDINEAAPWIDLTIPDGAYGGAIRIPDATSNSTHNPEVFAQTVNITLRDRNTLRFDGANTHDKMLLSFSPYFSSERGTDEWVHVDGIQLEEQANTEISTPSDLHTVTIGSVSHKTVQFSEEPAVIRIAEGRVTVTPSVTK